jgi:hypothetical protein
MIARHQKGGKIGDALPFDAASFFNPRPGSQPANQIAGSYAGYLDVYGIMAEDIDPSTAAWLLSRSETTGHGGYKVIPEEELQERLEMLRWETEVQWQRLRADR